MYFPEREQAEKYVEDLNKAGVLLADVIIHAYWNIEFRTYAYKDEKTKENHIREMESKGWEDNCSKVSQCLHGNFSDNPIRVKVNQFKRHNEVNQSKYINEI